MKYSSTRGEEKSVTFDKVLLNGLASDGGLYVPEKFPKFKLEEISKMKNLNYFELAHKVTEKFVQPIISSKDYFLICKKTYLEFSKGEIISLTKLNSYESILNLYHGPTYAFKDYALQLLGNLYDYILKKKKISLTILGATSGDTGSAAINGCSDSDLINMFILFPHNKVSEIQRKQMTTITKKNVFNLAINGNFDDCQFLVKEMFKNNKQKKNFNLAAINSINWVRIMGQIVYYFWSYLKFCNFKDDVIFSVPTGNFGNVYAGFVAKKMGLPIKKLIVASNSNDVLTRFFKSGKMEKKKAVTTISPSMDIQISSNFERLLYFYFENNSNKINELYNKLEKKGQFVVKKKLLQEILKTFDKGKLSDNYTKNTIKKIFEKYQIIVDPHTAVGINIGKKKYKNVKKIFLATAHYGKFINTVRGILGSHLELPKDLKKLNYKKEKFEVLENSISELERFMKTKLKV